jgi:hypothetical protein
LPGKETGEGGREGGREERVGWANGLFPEASRLISASLCLGGKESKSGGPELRLQHLPSFTLGEYSNPRFLGLPPAPRKNDVKNISGHILVDGRTRNEGFNAKIGYVEQDDQLMGIMTVTPALPPALFSRPPSLRLLPL